MQYSKVCVEALEYELPPIVVSSDEIEQQLKPVYDRLKLPYGRLEMMSGIKERRFWNRGTKPSDAAVLAGKKAIEKISFPKSKLGCVVMCSVCKDFLEPATATVVHRQLELDDDCLVYDLSNACLGILSGMISLANMIELGQVEAGLLVAGENSRHLVEATISKILTDEAINRKSIKPYFASLTIGSGAVAVVMSRSDLSGSGHEFKGGVSLSDTRYNNLCQGDAVDNGMMMHTDSEELMVRGVELAGRAWQKYCEEFAVNDDNIDCYCTHQVGKAHSKFLFEHLNIDISKNFPTLENLGNVGSVSCPITLAMAKEKGVVKQGDEVALLGIGSGINCTMLGIKW